MIKKTREINGLPWFKFWAGHFRSKTDHLTNAEVGAYVRLLASYWDNNGLPYSEPALTRIARIEAGDDVDIGALLGEFFGVRKKAIHHDELDEQRIEAIGEEDANRRRTEPARIALIEKRRSVTMPVTETEVDIDVEEEGERDGDQDRQPERDSHSDDRNQTHTQTEEPDPQADAHEDAGHLPITDDSVSRITVHSAPTREHQSVSLKPEGGAQGRAAPAASSDLFGSTSPGRTTGQRAQERTATGTSAMGDETAATSSAQSGISFRLKDGSSVPLSALVDESQLSTVALAMLQRRAKRYDENPETRVSADEFGRVINELGRLLSVQFQSPCKAA